jgi:PKD repeat protein
MQTGRRHGIRGAGWAVAAVLVLLVVGGLALTVSGTPPTHGTAALGPTQSAISPSPARARSSPDPAIHITLPHPTWVNVTNDSAGAAPPALVGGSAAYDPFDNETVYFGGYSLALGVVTNQTWVFARGGWTNETDPYAAPPARAYAAMDYDGNMRGVLLFGGGGALGELNDTWLFQSGIWTNLTPNYGVAPSPRFGATMAFDPDSPENGSVLFGGYSSYSTTGYLNDTWIWQGGAGWVPLATTDIAPPELVYASMAFDASDGYIVLFGGVTPGSVDSGQTWELYAGTWWAVQPSSAPAARSYLSMVYVPSFAGVLLFGGYSYETGSDFADTWLFSDGDWTEFGPATSPPELSTAAVALDGTGTTALVIGGENDSLGFDYNTTWAFEYVPGVLLEANVTSSEAGESVAFTAYLGGGTAPYEALFDFGDGSYASAAGPGPITADHTYSLNGTFDVSVEITDAVGALANSGAVEFTVAPPPRIDASAPTLNGDVGIAMSFVSNVLVPGSSALSFNWSFGDGTNAFTENTSHVYTAAGTYLVVVNANDSDHSTATASLTVTVDPDPSLTVAATSDRPPPDVATTFFANVTGGTGPYHYVWLFGDGTTASDFPAPQHMFATSGTYTVQAWVNDSVGGSSHQTLSVVVGSASSSSSGTAVPWWFWAGVGVLAAALIVGAVLLVLRGRR